MCSFSFQQGKNYNIYHWKYKIQKRIYHTFLAHGKLYNRNHNFSIGPKLCFCIILKDIVIHSLLDINSNFGSIENIKLQQCYL